MRLKVKKTDKELIFAFDLDQETKNFFKFDQEAYALGLSQDILVIFSPKAYKEFLSNPNQLSDLPVLQKQPKQQENLKDLEINSKKEQPLAPTQITKAKELKDLNSDEQALIKKLISIKFSDRTCPYVQKILNSKEKDILNRLLNRNLIQVYKSNKYPQGVYTLNKIFYSENKRKISDNLDFLEKFGYIVFDDYSLAFKFMEENKMKIEKTAQASKGFDKRYYIVLNSFLEKNKQKIFSLLQKGPKSSLELSQKLNIQLDGVQALLLFLAQEGEIIEKSKDLWSMVD
jgi:predicted O-linked N-acetylglucosamine transferase (SPINDLY family)